MVHCKVGKRVKNKCQKEYDWEKVSRIVLKRILRIGVSNKVSFENNGKEVVEKHVKTFIKKNVEKMFQNLKIHH